MINEEHVGDDGGVTVLSLEHGPVNAMDVELCRGLTERLLALRSSGRPIVLTGRGRAFSAGADLRRLLESGDSYVREFVPALAELFHAAFTLPVPLVAAVNGHAIAGGAVLASTADVVVMSEAGARMGAPELKVGMAFPHAALEVLRHRVGDVAARRVVLEAENYAPGPAHALGLVDEVVSPDRVLDRAIELATGLGSLTPPDTFALNKQQMRREATARMETADDGAVVELWCRRVHDGWTAGFLEQTTGSRNAREG